VLRPRPAGGPFVIFTNNRDSWVPFFSGGFGWNPCFVGYNQWRYSSGWHMGRYGPWGYDPFWSPYGYDPFDPYYDRYGRGYSRGESQTRSAEPLTGSIRLRVNPATAKVYVDGTLVGTVDEFNGLVHHLELAAGPHQLELRADGYETLTTDISVRAGKTTTERLSLKKIR